MCVHCQIFLKSGSKATCWKAWDKCSLVNFSPLASSANRSCGLGIGFGSFPAWDLWWLHRSHKCLCCHCPWACTQLVQSIHLTQKWNYTLICNSSSCFIHRLLQSIWHRSRLQEFRLCQTQPASQLFLFPNPCLYCTQLCIFQFPHSVWHTEHHNPIQFVLPVCAHHWGPISFAHN